MNDYLKRLLAASLIKFTDGEIHILGVPMIMRTAYINAYSDKLLCKTSGGRSLIFWSGYVQAELATGTSMKRHNYENKEVCYKTTVEQSDMLGAGKTEFVQLNFDKPEIILKCWSSLAKEHLRVYGKQKYPIDHWIRGSLIAILCGVNKIKDPSIFLCVETKCIAKGDPYCEFVLKKKKEFNLKDTAIKYQIPVKLPLPSELGQEEKIEVLPARII